MQKLIKKTIGMFVVVVVLLLSNVQVPHAIYDPLSVPNNKFGIHIIGDNDLDSAKELINSTGGDWGYVTLVIRQDERINDKWQDVFDRMRRLHIIPIVRIATLQNGGYWEKPKIEDIDSWVNFLDSLNWVTKNRYVIVGNEVNHATEWGNELSPEEYSDYLVEFSSKLKEGSDDFFVIQAGLDASAPNSKQHMDEARYLSRMIIQNENVFEFVDGWSSHSYPNPGFAGSAEEFGRGTVRTFEWEMNVLKDLGVKKDFPIFITETGWAHSGVLRREGIPDEEYISKNLKEAYENAWSDPQIVAVTPFVLNYQEEPFEKFSWTKLDGEYYEFFDAVRDISKQQGYPVQIDNGEIITEILPPLIGDEEHKVGIALAKNTGQSIWHKDNTTTFEIGEEVIEITTPIFGDIEPGEKGLVYFRKSAVDSTSIFAYNSDDLVSVGAPF